MMILTLNNLKDDTPKYSSQHIVLFGTMSFYRTIDFHPLEICVNVRKQENFDEDN